MSQNHSREWCVAGQNTRSVPVLLRHNANHQHEHEHEHEHHNHNNHVSRLRLRIVVMISVIAFVVMCPSLPHAFPSANAVILEASADDGENDWYSTRGRSLVLHVCDRNIKTIHAPPPTTPPSDASSSSSFAAHTKDNIGGGGTKGARDRAYAYYNGIGNMFAASSAEDVEGTEKVTASTAVKLVNFCIDCPNPEEQGSVTSALMSYHMMETMGNAALTFDIIGEAVYAIPNYVDHKKVLNAPQLKGRIALIKRGKIPLGKKVDRLLEKSRPSAIIIIDDGQCDEQFLSCGYRAGGAFQKGFSAFDDTDAWERALYHRIPVMMVTAETGGRFDSLMAIRKVDVLGMGESYMTILPLMDRNLGVDGYDDYAGEL